MTAFTLPHLLEEAAMRRPAALAVEGTTSGLSYSELEERAGEVASYLREVGVQQGDRVGVLLKKSPEAVAVLFGVMKAGAAYVPLDPSAPASRSAFIMQDCSVRALLTDQEGLTRSAPALNPSRPIPHVLLTQGTAPSPHIDTTVTTWQQAAELPPIRAGAVRSTETDLAYILYTSGEVAPAR